MLALPRSESAGVFRLSTKQVLLLLGIFLVLFGAFPSSLRAQATASAVLQGTIIDASGGVVGDVAVTLSSKDQGWSRTATTNSSGFYRFDLLPAGVYFLKFTHPGFATVTVDRVELLVGQTSTLDFTLKPGQVTEVIMVTEQAPLVDTEKTSVGLVVTPTDVNNLPLNGRDFANLAYLAPGARPVGSYDPTKNRIGIFGINGSNGRNVNVTVNGIDNKDNTVGGPVMQLPLTAVQEFNISTQRFSAANGRSEGAAVNVVTRSGANGFHGSGYFFDTQTAMNANESFVWPAPSAVEAREAATPARLPWPDQRQVG